MLSTYAAPTALPAALGVARHQVATALREVDRIITGFVARRAAVTAVHGPAGYTARLADWLRRRDALAAELADLEPDQ